MQKHPLPRGRSYSINEWCELRNLSRKTAYELINAGELRSYKVGVRRYITAESDAEFIQRKEAEAAA
tara:strand:+ start:184 stop:384 length:201 start_codon:yes stop_codon:yes gene_type:complete